MTGIAEDIRDIRDRLDDFGERLAGIEAREESATEHRKGMSDRMTAVESKLTEVVVSLDKFQNKALAVAIAIASLIGGPQAAGSIAGAFFGAPPSVVSPAPQESATVDADGG